MALLMSGGRGQLSDRRSLLSIATVWRFVLEDRLIEQIPNWVLLVAVVGVLLWWFIKRIADLFRDQSIRNREDLAKFADWQKRERHAEIGNLPFDRQKHRRNFLFNDPPYRNPYDYNEQSDISEFDEIDISQPGNKKLLKKLLDDSPNGVIRLGWFEDEAEGCREMRCIFANPAAGRFLLISSDNLVGQTSTELILHASREMDRSESESFVDQITQALTKGESFDAEIPVFGDPAQKWVRLILEPQGSDFVMTFIDISDRKSKEDALKQEITELKERLHELGHDR